MPTDPPSETTKLKPGDSLTCTVKSPETGGYIVTLIPSGIEGFLPSQETIDIGRVVPATFVCMDGNRALLAYAFMIGTTERVQLSTASDSENAFAVWADSYPRSIRLRRAVDLIMPPFIAMPKQQQLSPGNLMEFFETFEQSKFTGCIKMDSRAELSRSAILYYQGRAVGCVYTTKQVKDPFPIEMALEKTVEDLTKSDTDVESYDLPEPIVLSMSALFLGVVVERSEEAENKKYADEMIDQLAKRQETGCVTVNEKSSQIPCGLGFICNGEFKGAYSIEERKFRADRPFVDELFDKFIGAKVDVYILPSVMASDSVRFGYSMISPQFMTSNDELWP
jgi:hypothetical protein